MGNGNRVKGGEGDFASRQLRLERITEQLINRKLRRFDLATEDGKKSLEEFIGRIAERRKNLQIKPEFTPEVVGICKQILALG